MEAKPFASLSAGLLARKGTARPAMRRPYTAGAGATLPVSVQDDLGWNDMGEDHAPAPTPPLTVVKGDGHIVAEHPRRPAVHQQVQAAREPDTCEQEVTAPSQRNTGLSPAMTKAAFTLRLDPQRHLRLRLASAVNNRSAQQIVTEALDAFLDCQPEVERLAQQVPGDGMGRARTGTK